MSRGDDDREDPEGSAADEQGRAGEEPRSGLPELTRKVLTLGLGAYFLGEDYVRRAVKDAKLPREIGKSIAQNASKGKEELFGFVARELSQFLRQMDVQAELSRFAATHRIRLTTEIEFIPKAQPSSEDEKVAPEGAGTSSPSREDPELDVKVDDVTFRVEPREES